MLSSPASPLTLSCADAAADLFLSVPAGAQCSFSPTQGEDYVLPRRTLPALDVVT